MVNFNFLYLKQSANVLFAEVFVEVVEVPDDVDQAHILEHSRVQGRDRLCPKLTFKIQKSHISHVTR